MRRPIVLAVAGVLATAGAGCGGTSECAGSCPAIGGTYVVRQTTLAGGCDFVPWLPPPALDVQQAAGADQISVGLIDPVNKLTVPIVARLRVPDNGRAVVILDGFERTFRQAAASADRLVELQLFLTGQVVEKGGRRYLTGQLATVELSGGAACQTTQTFVGEGSAATP